MLALGEDLYMFKRNFNLEVFWNKLNLYMSWVFVAVLFIFLGFLLCIEIKGFDIWFHIGIGKYIWQKAFIPTVDIFSFTAYGQLWVNYGWLYQIISFLSFDSLGPQGLVYTQMFVVLVSFGFLLLLGFDRDRPFVSIATLLLVIFVYKTRLTYRPDIVSLFFFIVYFFILSSHLLKRWTLVSLFILQIVWTNIHGFFIFGPLILGISIFSEFVKRLSPLPWGWGGIGRLSDKEFHRLKMCCLVVIVACFLNPFFIEGVLYPFKVLLSLSGGDSDIFFKRIEELRRPITLDNIFSLNPYRSYRLLIILSMASFIANFRKVNIFILLMWGMFLLFSLGALRNMPIFSVMAYIAIVDNCRRIPFKKIQILEKRNIAQISIICKIFLIIFIGQCFNTLVLHGYYDFSKMNRKFVFDGQINLRNHSHQAVDFLVQNNIQGNFFNNFNSGAYLIGRTFPNIKVYIDGRAGGLYEGKFFLESQSMWNGKKELLEENLSQYGVTGAFLSSVDGAVSDKLVKFFYTHKDWKLVYFDYDAAIFLKDMASNKRWINHYEIDVSHWKTKDNGFNDNWT